MNRRAFLIFGAIALIALSASPCFAWLEQACPPNSATSFPSQRRRVVPSEEVGCDSRDVHFAPVTADLTYTCGQTAPVLLSNSGNCTLVTGGLEVCNGQLRDCVLCTAFTPVGSGWRFDCPTLGEAGTQVLTATYLLGPLQGTIATAVQVSCASPFVTPTTPPPPHTPVPCDSNTVSFSLNGPFTCGGSFGATLRTTSGCNLSSGGALVCDSLNRNCIPCPATGSGSTVSYNCTAKTSPGSQIVTATYQLGPFIGTIASAADMGC